MRATVMTEPGVRAGSIGVVIPTKNRPRSTVEAIESVLHQLGRGDRCVVVDNGSTDETPVLAEAAMAELVHERRPGACWARNSGVAALDTEWVVFLDSDDLALPGWLARFRTAAGPEVGLVCCGAAYGSGAIVAPRDMGPAFNGVVALFLGGAYMVRRSVFLRVGGFDVRQPSGQHTELALRLLEDVEAHSLRVASIEAPGIHVRIHDGPRVRTDDRAVLVGTEMLLSTHHQALAREPDVLSAYHATAGHRSVRVGERRRAIAHFAAALGYKPGLSGAARLTASTILFPVYRRWAMREQRHDQT